MTDNHTSPSTPYQPPTPPDAMGVYVRQEADATGRPPHQKELDVLWAKQPRQWLKDEHHPVLNFTGGFILGVLVTLLLTNVCKWIPQPVDNGQAPVPPASNELLQEPTALKETPTTVSPTTPDATATGENGEAPVPQVNGQVYKVKSGDTMGSIAAKFYGDASPAYIEKLLKANGLANANRLSLDQELVIPPKAY
ncbi:MAG: LysM peptidoglycan-binding domain-containing protein [Vampirovibrionales bacterium]